MLLNVSLLDGSVCAVNVRISSTTTAELLCRVNAPDGSMLMLGGRIIDASDTDTLRTAGVSSAACSLLVFVPVHVHVPARNVTLYLREGPVHLLKQRVRDATFAAPPLPRMGLVRAQRLLGNDEFVAGGERVYVVERFGTEETADDVALYVSIIPHQVTYRVPYARGKMTPRQLVWEASARSRVPVHRFRRAICKGRRMSLTASSPPLDLPNGSLVFILG